MIALLNLSVLGFLLVVFHDKAKRTQQGNLLGQIRKGKIISDNVDNIDFVEVEKIKKGKVISIYVDR